MGEGASVGSAALLAAIPLENPEKRWADGASPKDLISFLRSLLSAVGVNRTGASWFVTDGWDKGFRGVLGGGASKTSSKASFRAEEVVGVLVATESVAGRFETIGRPRANGGEVDVNLTILG